MTDETLPDRPGNLSRPKTGLAAWEATVSYIAEEHHPDALLILRVYPVEGVNRWSALLEWGAYLEQTEDATSLANALTALWQAVDQSHIIFKDAKAKQQRPTGYGEYDWVGADTKEAVERLLWVVRVVFKSDWSLVAFYRPIEDATRRVQMRLIAKGDEVHIGGRGPTLKDAASQLYRNATPHFSGSKD